MNRAIFPAVTMVLSGLVFAGVWTMTDPARAGVAAIAPVAVPIAKVVRPSAVDRDAPPIVARRTVPRAKPAFVRRTHHIARLAAVVPSDVYYSGCREVRAAGAAPLYRGQPGYRTGMDGDNDGIACEAYRGG